VLNEGFFTLLNPGHLLRVPSNGEVEGPHRSAGPRRRGRTISQRPRRQTKSASRTPPTIVRSHPHRSLLCACVGTPASEGNIVPGLSAPIPQAERPRGQNPPPPPGNVLGARPDLKRNRISLHAHSDAPIEDACETGESATVRTPQRHRSQLPALRGAESPLSDF
jgi:hypothetical protein